MITFPLGTYKDAVKGWRTACCVPGCRRSRAGRWNWICCADHWRPVRRDLKLTRSRLKARFKRRGEIEETKKSYWTTTDRARSAMNGIYRRLIRDAIEKASGL